MGYNIAIDGPAGAGKSTIAKLVAKELGFIYVDTGAMYRGLAVHFLKKGIVPGEVEKIEAACEDAKVELGYENGVQQVYLNGENITSQLREEAVGNMASVSSAVPAVRAKLLDLQRNLAKEKDLKTIAFPLISAGVYGYPQRDAIRVAIETMKLHQDDFDEITLVLFGEREFGLARDAYPEFI